MADLASLTSSSPFVVFLAVFLGVLLGQVRIGSFSLGASGTLFSKTEPERSYSRVI